IIMGRAGIRQAYATGRGKIVVRARTEFEEYGRDHRTRIIVTELPYQVNKRQLIRNIADQVKEKRLDGISDLRDESDRSGMRMVIELKRDANPQVVLNRLFLQTQLQASFSIIMLALVNNQTQPKILSLRQILDEYLTFQMDVITRRTRYDLRKARERAHLLEGLLIAQDHIDEVIRIIRSSYDDAKQNLMARFDLDEIQAQAILDMRLRALQGLDREKLQAEYDEIAAKIRYYEGLLADPALIRGVLKDELLEIREKYGSDRVTEIQEVDNEIDVEDLIENEMCVYTATRLGYIKRLQAAQYRAQRRGGRGVSGMATREEDLVSSVFATMTHNYILFFTNRGRVFRLKGYQIPLAGRNARGTNMVNLLQLNEDEKVTAILPVEIDIDDYVANQNAADDVEETEDLTESGHYLFFVTKLGTVKRVNVDSIGKIRRSGLRVISLREDDELISVFHTDGDRSIILASQSGRGIHFDEREVRVMGRNAGGVRGIDLPEGDCVVGAVAVSGDELLLSVTQKGYGKRTKVGDYPMKHRAGMGVISHDVTEKTGPVAGIRVISEEEDLLLITSDGQIIRMGVEDIRITGRASQGVILMRSQSEVIDIAAVQREEEDDAEEELPAEEAAETAEETGDDV
ncbi:MAG: DNA gyrase subunit A, partial [Ruminococcaceae bacterium]|nr:DNA gyrase subunit A [Oscillospiraceae bacterium]